MANSLFLSSIIFVIVAIGLISVFLLSKFIGPQNLKITAKNEVYESGVTRPVGNTNIRFSVKFYLVAILFVLFDVEIIFLFPWAMNVEALGWFGLIEMFIFMGFLFAGLLYIYGKKALLWD